MGDNSNSSVSSFLKTGALLVVMTVGLALVATLVFRMTAVQPPASSPKKSAAIVLLAGAYEERAPVAASLYLAGYAPRILLTDDGVRRGWSPEHQRNLYAIERTEIELVKRGVPPAAIVRLPFRKSGTVYDALAVRDYLEAENLRSLILVTSEYHTRRASWIFRHVLHNVAISISTAPSRSLLPRVTEWGKLMYYMVRLQFL